MYPTYNMFAYNIILILISIGIVLYVWDAVFPPDKEN